MEENSLWKHIFFGSGNHIPIESIYVRFRCVKGGLFENCAGKRGRWDEAEKKQSCFMDRSIPHNDRCCRLRKENGKSAGDAGDGK